MQLVAEVLTSDVDISPYMPGKADLSWFTCGTIDHSPKEIGLQKITNLLLKYRGPSFLDHMLAQFTARLFNLRH